MGAYAPFFMEAEQQERLKLIVRNLKSLVEALESEVYSDVTKYSSGSSAAITDYDEIFEDDDGYPCLLYTSPSPRDLSTSRMPSSA